MVNELLEDVFWLSFAQKGTSLCAARLFHTASQSIAKGNEGIHFEGALLAQEAINTDVPCRNPLENGLLCLGALRVKMVSNFSP